MLWPLAHLTIEFRHKRSSYIILAKPSCLVIHRVDSWAVGAPRLQGWVSADSNIQETRKCSPNKGRKKQRSRLTRTKLINKIPKVCSCCSSVKCVAWTKYLIRITGKAASFVGTFDFPRTKKDIKTIRIAKANFCKNEISKEPSIVDHNCTHIGN